MVKFGCKLQLKLQKQQSFKPVPLNHFLLQNIPIYTVNLNLQNKQGSIWYLGKFKRICVDFPITMIQVNLTILMYNKLFLKQETPIDNQPKPSFRTLLKVTSTEVVKCGSQIKSLHFTHNFDNLCFLRIFLHQIKQDTTNNSGVYLKYWHLPTSINL